jgi:hypothetical protein
MATSAPTSSLTSIDPMFAAPVGANPNPSAPAPSAPQPSTTDAGQQPDALSGIDPMFAMPPGPSAQGVINANAANPSPFMINPSTGALTGAVLGSVAGKAMPMQMPTAPGYNQAVIDAQVKQQAAQRMQQQLTGQQTNFGQQLTDLQTGLGSAQASLSDAVAEHAAALANANKFGVGPEPEIDEAKITPEEKALPGDKWNKAVVGDMGPGGKSVTESARNYRIQQSLSNTERAKFKANRAGLIVPNELPVETPLTPDQQNAKDELERAEKKLKEARTLVAQHQGKIDSLTKKGATSRQFEEKVATKAEAAQAATDKLKLLEKMKPGALSTVGKFLGKLPLAGALSGAGTGYEAAQTANEFNKGNYGLAALHGISTLGGLAAMTPYPAAKAIGMGLQAPQLAYDIYQEMK